jgi:uncharacterized protein (DUF1330 family)
MRVIGLISLRDAEAFERYRAAVSATVERHGGRIVGRSTPLRIFWDEIGCGPIDAVVELEFPDLEAAQRWADSPDYAAILVDRQSAMKLLLMAVGST